MIFTTAATGIDPKEAPNALITTLEEAMTAAAFLGIAWYLSIEFNTRLFFRATRRSLYFWSCLLCSWGIIVHSVSILLANFGDWNTYCSLVVIGLSWLTFVVSQSLVLYSRLSLVLVNPRIRRCVLYMISINAVIFGLTTIVFGGIALHPSFEGKLTRENQIWDRIQVTAFALQETFIGLLYIRVTASHLKNMTLLGTDRNTTRHNLRCLIAVNVLIIILDCSVIALCYGGYFYLQGFHKVAIYAIKLRTEFMILNQLHSSLAGTLRNGPNYVGSGHMQPDSGRKPKPIVLKKPKHSGDSDVEMVGAMGDDHELQMAQAKMVTPSNRPNIVQSVTRDA